MTEAIKKESVFMRVGKRLVVFIFCLVLVSSELSARVVGSNSAAARQVATFYPNSETNNQMLGFSMFEKGIMLADSTTTCTYDATFPVSGNVTLNGGTLFLLRDMELKAPYYLGPGRIDGQGWCALAMGAGSPNLNIPATGFDRLINSKFSTTVGAVVNSVDWSYDGKYILLGRQSATGNEVQIFYVAPDQSISAVAGLDLGAHVTCVRWHPSSYYFALGKAAVDYLETYLFTPGANTITKISGGMASTVNAVAWNPQGTKLSVGLASGTNVTVYDVANGVLGTSYTTSYSVSSRVVQKNAMSWDASGQYLAVGCDSNATEPEIFVFNASGASVSKVAQAEVGAIVYSVAWHPTLPYLVAGISAGSDRLPLYYFNSGAGTLTALSALAAVANSVYAAHWNPSGTTVAATTATTTYAYDVNMFAFDSTLNRLSQMGGYRVGLSYNDVTWSPDGLSLCVGGASNAMRAFSFSVAPVIFKNVNVFLNSNVTITGPVVFEGNCVINGEGNVLSFGSNGSIAIASGGSLTLDETYIDGIVENAIGCVDNTSSLKIKNSEWSQDSAYTFSVGSLSFQGKVLLSGDFSTFQYTSSQLCTVLAYSELVLDKGFNFYYNPVSGSDVGFVLAAQNSKLKLYGSILQVASGGLILTKGVMSVSRDSQIIVDNNGDFTLGSSTSRDDDVELSIGGGVMLDFHGTFNYKNVDSTSLFLANISTILFIDTGSILNLYQSVNLKSGILAFGPGATLARAAGKQITGTVQPQGNLLYASL